MDPQRLVLELRPGTRELPEEPTVGVRCVADLLGIAVANLRPSRVTGFRHLTEAEARNRQDTSCHGPHSG